MDFEQLKINRSIFTANGELIDDVYEWLGNFISSNVKKRIIVAELEIFEGCADKGCCCYCMTSERELTKLIYLILKYKD